MIDGVLYSIIDKNDPQWHKFAENYQKTVNALLDRCLENELVTFPHIAKQVIETCEHLKESASEMEKLFFAARDFDYSNIDTEDNLFDQIVATIKD